MRIKRVLAVLCLALPMGAGSARAAGQDPFNFLFLDANARPVAMGGAYTALASDENALLYNPAGLGRVGRYGATFMHDDYVSGISQEYAAFVAPQGWGANLNFLNSGRIPQTTISNPDGTGLGTTGLTDMALTAGYGRALSDALSVGAGVKYIREAIADVTGSGFGFDLGALYSVAQYPGLALGAAVQNLGPAVKFQSAAENMPWNIRGGAAYSFNALGQDSAVSLDIMKERTDAVGVGFGVETVVAKMMPIRFGFNSRNSAGIGVSAGVGWRIQDLSLDYAFVPYGDLGDSHRVSATWRWGGASK